MNEPKLDQRSVLVVILRGLLIGTLMGLLIASARYGAKLTWGWALVALALGGTVGIMLSLVREILKVGRH